MNSGFFKNNPQGTEYGLLTRSSFSFSSDLYPGGPRLLGQFRAFLRQVKKTKVVSYHLKEVLVPTRHTTHSPTTTGVPRVLGQFRGFSEAS